MTILRLLLLTILPSAIFTVLYIAIGMLWQGVPSIALFFIIALPTLFAFEISVMIHNNKNKSKSAKIKSIFEKYNKLPLWKIILYAFILFGFAGLMLITIAPLESKLLSGAIGKLNSLLPSYFDWNNIELIKLYPKGILIFTSILYILMNGFICPIIEEIYFRGYLTSKLKRYGIAAPIIVTFAFSFYHWWLPFNNIFRISIFLVASLIAYKKNNIYITMWFHCICNIFSSICFVLALL